MNLAIIDIGSNSFHLEIVNSPDLNHFTLLERNKVVHRLASNNQSGETYISRENIVQGVEIVRGFQKLSGNHGAEIYAIATSAVRDAVNRDDFIGAIYKQCGFYVTVLTGMEEAALIYRGASLKRGDENSEITVVDIGGGSTEIIKGRGSEIYHAVSLNIGAVRLGNMFVSDLNYTEEKLLLIQEYISKVLIENIPDKQKLISDTIIGTSGSFNSVYQFHEFLYGEKSELLDIRLVEIIQMLCKTRPDVGSRLKLNFPDKRKLEILPAGSAIILSVAEYLGFSKFYYSDFAIREGLISTILKEKREKN